jgi:hypothetical protein
VGSSQVYTSQLIAVMVKALIIKKVILSLKSKDSVNLQFLYCNKFHNETNQPKKSSYRLIVLLQSKCRGALFTCKRQEKGNF